MTVNQLLLIFVENFDKKTQNIFTFIKNMSKYIMIGKIYTISYEIGGFLLFRIVAGFKMGVKISLALVFILGLLSVIAGTSILSSYELKAEIQEIDVSNQRSILAAKAENEYTGAVLEIRRFIADGDDQYSKNFADKLNNVMSLETQLLELTGAGQGRRSKN